MAGLIIWFVKKEPYVRLLSTLLTVAHAKVVRGMACGKGGPAVPMKVCRQRVCIYRRVTGTGHLQDPRPRSFMPSILWDLNPKALRTVILRFLGPKTILHKALGCFEP